MRILEMGLEWTLVDYQGRRGWILTSQIRLIPDRSAAYPSQAYFRVAVSPPPALQSETGLLTGFLKFVSEEERALAEVTDPLLRRTIQEEDREWGRLFIAKTPLFNARGVRLYDFLDARCAVNLAQGQFRYRDLYGPTWSDLFEEQVLDSNRGILRNRALFRRGRHYFLELRYTF